MNFDSYLKESAQKIDEELEKILAGFLKDARGVDGTLLPLALGFVNSCKGGKRIRGMLVRLGYDLVSHLPGERQVISGSHLEGVMRIAAAYEILHTAILIHDDIIDESPARRDKPSLYMLLGGNHYGKSQALGLGDMGFFLAMKIISESEFYDREKNLALKHLSGIMIDTTIGEILDIEKGADPLTVMRLKTARYTFCGPLILGAILAGSSSHLPGMGHPEGEGKAATGSHLRGGFGSLERFGESLGIAYQIRDDLLDKEYKLGTAEECEQKVLEYSAQARKIIPEITENVQMRKLLEEMVGYLVQRTK